MAEKKPYKINLSTLFLILAIILILLMGYSIYTLYNINTNSKEEISKLKSNLRNTTNISESQNENTVISSNQTNISNLNKYTKITKELEGNDYLNANKIINNNDNTYTIQGIIYTQYTIPKKEVYKSVTLEKMKIKETNYYIYGSQDINEDDYSFTYYLMVNKTNDYNDLQSNSTYILTYNNTNNTYIVTNTTENPDEFKQTNKYMEITVSNNTNCIIFGDNLEDSKTISIEELYKNFIEGNYRFKFQNGKCIQINEIIIGH